ncbi:MAG: GLUG motif-containing protein [Faecousia sp.]
MRNLGIVDSYIEVTSTSGSCYVGGIVGYASNSAITNCYNTGSVTATATSPSSSSYGYAGGIVGYAYSNTTITDCYNTGSVSSSYDAGGIVGRAYSSIITDCYNTGSVTATATPTSSSSDAYAGGIVGRAYEGTTITNCNNTGSVTAKTTSGSSDAYAGGIVGHAYSNTTITDCYNTGSVSSSYDAGGIVGRAYSSIITDCYNTGSVTATATSSSSRAYAGGIVGETESSTITNCYYLNIIAKGVGSGTDTATACTAEQMKQQATFAGFDFDTVWTMEGHEDFLFPELQTVPMVFTDSVVDVSIETLPDKLTFEEGIPLDTSGGMLKVSYLGGKVIEVPLEVSMVTGFDNSAPGEQILTVTYEGKTTTYTVTVTHSYETEWSQDETYHWHACSACGDKTDKTEHVYDNTCDTTCNVCGYTRTITHSFGNWAVTEEPTCTEKGEKTRTCATCGKTETRELEALGHDYKDTVTDPTCTEQGHTTHTCTRCDDSYVDTYVDALGHDLGEWTEIKAATCTEKGEERRDCARCEYYETREVEVLGHAYKDTATDPTCTEQGYTTHTCSRCDDSYVDTYVDALGHAWDDGVITKQPTATESGVKTFTCTRCGATRTEPIPATGNEPCDGGEDCPSGKFVDVNTKAWYHLYVDYAVKNGLFGGTSENTFEPEAAMTRAMLVTVLWRYEGKPMGYQNTFVDVNAKSGSWYIDAVAWAAANNIVGGIGNGKFDPESKITREQMATILFRYANWKDIDTNKRGDLSNFPDADKVSGYATSAMQWAVAEGLINGSDGKLLPQGNATRAQVATILVRFIENIV